MDFPNWEEVELLTAALHHESTEGAIVTWNDKILGRQFDVTVRFSKGGYKYLTIVECKNEKTRLAVKEVEAFVTKSRHVHANKAVMVSTSGYQSGGIDVAQREGIVLLDLEERMDPSPREHNISVIRMLKNVKTSERTLLDVSYTPTPALLDANVRDSLAKSYALVDQDGNTVTEAFLTDLRLGQWGHVEAGKFYRQPIVNGYYFCEGVSPSRGLIVWVLVESFQHGDLLQGRFEQEQKYASSYHLVTEKEVIRRLEDRLRKIWRKRPPWEADSTFG